MTRIEFLHDAPDRLNAAADWLREACRKRESVVVFVPDRPIAEQMDRLLWIQPAISFCPHCKSTSPLASETPIVLADTLDRVPHDRCLMNLANTLPPEFSRFENVIEIVSAAGADRLPARERFKFYRERGYSINARSIATGL